MVHLPMMSREPSRPETEQKKLLQKLNIENLKQTTTQSQRLHQPQGLQWKNHRLTKCRNKSTNCGGGAGTGLARGLKQRSWSGNDGASSWRFCFHTSGICLWLVLALVFMLILCANTAVSQPQQLQSNNLHHNNGNQNNSFSSGGSNRSANISLQIATPAGATDTSNKDSVDNRKIGARAENSKALNNEESVQQRQGKFLKFSPSSSATNSTSSNAKGVNGESAASVANVNSNFNSRSTIAAGETSRIIINDDDDDDNDDDDMDNDDDDLDNSSELLNESEGEFIISNISIQLKSVFRHFCFFCVPKIYIFIIVLFCLKNNISFYFFA